MNHNPPWSYTMKRIVSTLAALVAGVLFAGFALAAPVWIDVRTAEEYPPITLRAMPISRWPGLMSMHWPPPTARMPS